MQADYIHTPGTRPYYRVTIEAGEIVPGTDRSLPYPTYLGTVYPDTGRINVGHPAAPIFRGYMRAAREWLRTIADGLTPVRFLPKVGDLAALIREIKRAGIGDEYRASEDDDRPGICLTIGWAGPDTVNQWGRPIKPGSWSYQTGDNSYSGGAYGYPHWAVVSIYRRSNARDLAREIRDQLLSLVDG